MIHYTLLHLTPDMHLMMALLLVTVMITPVLLVSALYLGYHRSKTAALIDTEEAR